MSLPRLLPALLVSLSLALAACGGSGDDGGGVSGGGGDEGSGTTRSASAQETFSTTCGGCHTLSAAGTEGQTGPNLDELRPDAARVKAAIEQGPSIMPEDLLAGAKADEVAQYVAENAGR